MKARPIAVFLVGAAFLLLITLPLYFRMPASTGNMAHKEFNEAGHTILFTLVQLGLIWTWLNVMPARFNSLQSRWRVVAGAALLGLVMGIGIEWLQPFFHRDASWLDVLRNCFGILAGSAGYWAIQAKVDQGGGIRWGYLSAAAVFFAMGFATMVYWFFAQQVRDDKFPVLMDFEAAIMDPYLIGYSSAQVQFGAAPAQWLGNSGRAAQLTFPAQPQWNGFVLRAPKPHWQGYDTLTFELYSPMPEPVRIGVNLLPPGSRKPIRSQQFDVLPGLNTLSLALAGDKPIAQYEIMDVVWYSATPNQVITLWLDNVVLEQ